MSVKEEENIVIDEQPEVPEFAKPDMQEARGFLRERFLRFMMGIVGKRADFHMKLNTNVSGEYHGCDVECSKLMVKNLETPLGVIPNCLLRASDVISFDINNLKPSE